MTDIPDVVRRALEAECGNPIVEEHAVDATTRAALERVATEHTWSPEFRNRAVYLLGLWPDDETVAVIGQAVPSLDQRGRMAAGSVLARIHSRAALDLLDPLVRDDSDDVRRVAINAIGESDQPHAAALLRRVASEDHAELNRERAKQVLPP